MNKRLPVKASTLRRSKNSFTFVPLSTPLIKAGIALRSRRSHSIASAGSINSDSTRLQYDKGVGRETDASEAADEAGEATGEATGETPEMTDKKIREVTGGATDEATGEGTHSPDTSSSGPAF